MTAPIPEEKKYQELSLADLRAALVVPAQEIGKRFRGFVIENLSIDPSCTLTPWKNGTRFLSVSDGDKGSAKITVSKAVWQRAVQNGYTVTNDVAIDVAIESLYIDKRMQLQIAAMAIRVTGQSQLEAKRNAINQYCEEKGFFTRKKPQCPTIITRIAIITTEYSSIESDITRQIRLKKDLISSYRFDGTPQGLTRTLTTVIAKQCYDIICLYRGGREDEAMFVYSDPMVLDEIVRSPTPIASALGHERDIPPVQRVVSLGYASPSKFALSVKERNEQAWVETYQLMKDIDVGFKSYLANLKNHVYEQYSEIKEVTAELKRLNDKRRHRRNIIVVLSVAVTAVVLIWFIK